MNSLKPLLTVAVLAGIGYGVYVRINSGADAPPPAGVAAGWDATPKVQLPDSGSAAPATPWGGVGGGSGSSVAPPFGGPLGTASSPPVARGNEAPPFNAPPAASARRPMLRQDPHRRTPWPAALRPTIPCRRFPAPAIPTPICRRTNPDLPRLRLIPIWAHRRLLVPRWNTGRVILMLIRRSGLPQAEKVTRRLALPPRWPA